MRSLLFVLLVACGGGTASSPPPVVASEPPTTTTQPRVAKAPRPACAAQADPNDVPCALDTLQFYTDAVCACTDKACGEGVQAELVSWGTEMAKKATDRKLDPAMAKRSSDILVAYSECLTKLLMIETPPTDPCGADPCGN